MRPKNINTVTNQTADVLLGYTALTGKAGVYLAGRPFIMPKQFGAVAGEDGDATAALDLMWDFAIASGFPVLIDDVYVHVGQTVVDGPLEIYGTDGSKIISQITGASAAWLVTAGDQFWDNSFNIHKEHLSGASGTVITIGKTAYATQPTASLRNFHIGPTITRNDETGDTGNVISASGWIENIQVPATIYGNGLETAVVFHWGAHSDLTDIDTYTYHPTGISLEGLRIIGTDTGVQLSSVANVTGHYTAIDVLHPFTLVPGDNAADYANPDQAAIIGSGIDVSFWGSGASADKAVYITGLGNSPFDGKLHSLNYTDLRIRGYVELASAGADDQQIWDIENMTGNGEIFAAVKNAGTATVVDYERVVGRFELTVNSDSTRKGMRIVRSRGYTIHNSQITRPRFTTTPPTTYALQIYGEAIASTLAANLSVGGTILTIGTAFGVRAIPGDAIEIVQSGLSRTVYVAQPATATDTAITIRPAGAAALATDPGTAAPAVITLRTDIADAIIRNNLLAGHLYGIGLDFTFGASFQLKNVTIENNLFREIGDRCITAVRLSQSNILKNSDRDCGIKREIDGTTSSRFLDLDTCSYVNIEKNTINANSSPNVNFGIVNNAASSRLHMRNNWFGRMAAGADTNAFSTGSAASQIKADNYYLSGTAA